MRGTLLGRSAWTRSTLPTGWTSSLLVGVMACGQSSAEAPGAVGASSSAASTSTSGAGGGGVGGSGAGGSAGSKVKLSVTVTGAGSGKVTADPGKIACGAGSGTCSDVYDPGTKVTLTAKPDPGYVFHGWAGGGCTGGGPCVVTADADKSVRAAFVMIAFDSARKLDGSDALGSGAVNLWTVKTDGTGLTPVTKLTAAKVYHQQPQWSPDGTTLVFVSNRKADGTDAVGANQVDNIWTVKADGTKPTGLTATTATGSDSDGPRWSPDGATVAFHSSRNAEGTDAPNTNNARNIWTVKGDGTGLAPTTKAIMGNSDSFYPRWSPDGSWLVFASSRKLDGSDAGNTGGFFNVWVVKPDGTGLKPVTKGTATSSFAASWSPDGAQIVFASSRKLDGSDASNPTGTGNVWTVKADGTGLGHLTALTAAFAYNDGPQWSPDGSKIAFHSNRKLDGSDATNANPNTSNIWIMGADGGGVKPLTKATVAAAGSSTARWSADGGEIAFHSQLKLDGSDASNLNAALNVWLARPDGTALVPVTTTTAAGVANLEPQM